MRELKFRAWDKATKRYYNVAGVSFEKGRLVEVYLEDYPTSYEGNEDCKKPDEVILELYTGLNDINGVEICEGDVLEDGEGYPIEYWIVKFEDGKFIGSTWGVDEDIYELTDLEVVGNIHENQDLLGDTNIHMKQIDKEVE